MNSITFECVCFKNRGAKHTQTPRIVSMTNIQIKAAEHKSINTSILKKNMICLFVLSKDLHEIL